MRKWVYTCLMMFSEYIVPDNELLRQRRAQSFIILLAMALHAQRRSTWQRCNHPS